MSCGNLSFLALYICILNNNGSFPLWKQWLILRILCPKNIRNRLFQLSLTFGMCCENIAFIGKKVTSAKAVSNRLAVVGQVFFYSGQYNSKLAVNQTFKDWFNTNLDYIYYYVYHRFWH